jgi:small subunit ribosomal protein S6
MAVAIVPRSMPDYDLMVLLDADAPEDRRTSAVAEVEKLIGGQGEMLDVHEWGVRRMAYEIDHHAEAEYRLFQFRGENDLLERLRHSLKIMDGVLRFRIIRLKPGAPPPPAPRDQPPRQREEREPDGRVAARAAADAPPPPE